MPFVIPKMVYLACRAIDMRIPGALYSWTFQKPRKVLAGQASLARMFHEGGCVPHVFAKRIHLPGRFLGIAALRQFAPIPFQEKCAVTD